MAAFPACDRRYRAAHDSGTRPLTAIKYVVLHSTESPPGSAKAVAEYFTTQGSGGSAHLVVDDTSCYGCLPDNVTPWGAPPVNQNGFHIEQCGYAAWSRKEWLSHEATVERAAYKAALRCKTHDLRLVWLDSSALQAGAKSGITTHAAVSDAFHLSDHHDPGVSYPADRFMHWLKHYAGAK